MEIAEPKKARRITLDMKNEEDTKLEKRTLMEMEE